MATEMKFKKMWEGESQETTVFNQTISLPFQNQLIGYTFLKNLWGNYLFDKQELSSEDKIDNINKIVGMMKAQVKLMILSQNKQATDKENTHCQLVNKSEAYNCLEASLDQMKKKYEASKAKEEQLNSIIEKQKEEAFCLQQENHNLRNQVQQLRQAKNKVNQQIISLSNRCYQLERFHQTSSSASLDQFSAITVQKDEQNEDRPRVSLFGRKDSKILESLCQDNLSVHSEQQILEEKETFNELSLNLPSKNRYPMKQSLQCNQKQQSTQENYGNFIQEMKLIKLKTERIMGAQNDKFTQRDLNRKTLQPYTSRPQLKDLGTPVDILKEKRFRRIR